MKSVLSVALKSAILLSLGSVSAWANTKCVECGCDEGHCNAGVTKHLTCPVASRNAQRVTEYAVHIAETNRVKDCKAPIFQMATLLEYNGFSNITRTAQADDIVKFLSESGDWETVSVEQAVNYANGGNFVIGGAIGRSIGQNHGHIFTVLPKSKYISGTNWREMSALEGRLNTHSARLTTGNEVFREAHRSSVSFFRLKN